ncbi:MAG: ABC transporter ATP-binding protein [Clostridiales bacterium]|nr:ABC transporter ATP-binding protein [Clostridiales bacterium]
MIALYKQALRSEKGRLLAIVLLMAADTIAQSALPMIMSRLINLSTQQGASARPTAALMLGLIVLSCLVSVVLCRLSMRTAQSCQNSLRKKTFHHMLQLSPMQVREFSLGELLTRIMSDTGIVADFIMQSIFVFIKPLLLIIVGVVMLMRVQMKLMTVVYLIVPIQLVLLVITIRRMLPYFSRIQTNVEKLNSHMQESMDCIRLIKAYTGEEDRSAAFDKKNGQLYEASISIQLWTAMLNPVIMLLMNLGTMILLFSCSMLLQRHEIDAGGVMAGFAYIQQIFMSLMMLGEFFPNISRVRISGKRIRHFFGIQPAVKDGDDELPKGPIALELENVSHHFSPDAPPVLRDISLSIPARSAMALAGGTGSGKTTLLRLLCRMTDATQGRILINGKPVQDYQLESLYEQVQLVEQNCRLFADTLANNIRCGFDATDEEVLQAAREAQLEPLIASLPEGINTYLSESSASLSGGQRQCLAVARALLRKPRVLLLDDSSSSMDLDTEHRLMTSLLSSQEERTLLVVSQRVSTLSRFPRIAMLDDAQLVCLGDHEAMLEGCEAYRRLCDAQKAEEGRQ